MGALALTYLLVDELRIYASDFTAGEIMGMNSQGIWLGIAIYMMPPIVTLFPSLKLTYPTVRKVNIIVAIFLFGFNLI